MAVQLTDDVIAQLIAATKPLPVDYKERIKVRPKCGHKERELLTKDEQGNEFVLILRQSLFNEMDFSVILTYRLPNTNQLFRLRRYNGKSHEHSNELEREEPFYGFHIHTATERYQMAGFREDTFAEPTDRFADLQGAINCMIKDCGFIRPPELQSRMFGEED